MNLYRVLAAVTASAIAAVLLAAPANADSGTSPVTLTITSGTLSISMPGSTLALTATSNASSTNTATTSLGLVTVTDSRSASPASWSTTVSSTDFVAPTPTAANSKTPPPIPVSNISYTVYGSDSTNAGALSQAQGNSGSLITGNTAAHATYTAPLSTSPQAFVSTNTGVGDAVVTWNPFITITIPSTAVAGVAYAATITQSVL